MKSSKILITLLFALILVQCKKSEHADMGLKAVPSKSVTTFIEGFESGSKTAYADATVSLGTGSWDMNDALIGNLSGDAKNGSWSARVRNSGTITMLFNKPNGAGAVTILHAKYGSDANGTWALYYSTDSGTTWTQSGSSVSTTSTTLATATFNINVQGKIRLQIKKTDGGSNRINFDDITIPDYSSSSNPAPTETSVSPNTAYAGGSAFTLTVTGTNFISGSVVKWNGTSLTTTYVSSTSLTASVPATDIASAGTDSVKVFNPTPGGGTSASKAFTVSNNPSPTETSISPNSATKGGSAFTLTVSGTNFVSGSVVKWNGTGLTTTYVSGTTLTASVPATDISSAGTDSVNVFNPTPGGGSSTYKTFTVSTSTSSGKKFLFDNTKAETAGNADWVIDEDNGSAARYPTPAQSNITSSTSETYWKGAISSWGISLVKLGNTVETLPSGGSITYGNSSNAQDLSNYDVFVVDEPNVLFTTAEKTAIMNFVKNGGGLFMVSDHHGSDRNNDGYDSPDIWDDLITNNSVQNYAFGFTVDKTDYSETSTNVLKNYTGNKILNGSQGKVSEVVYSDGASLTLDSTKNSTVQGLIWRTSATSQGSTNAMVASSTFGSGRVFIITDSSPADDGTGASGNTLYNGWGANSSTPALHLNASLWLAKIQ